MCEYISFLVDLAGEKFLFHPDLLSHSSTHDMHQAKADKWREAEWTKDDDGASLTVRVHSDDPHDDKWLRACILAKWPTRKALEDWLIVNEPMSRIECRMAKGGDMSTLTGGDRSTLTGGDRSTLTGGDRSTLTGGDESTLTGGHWSTLTGGDRSTLTGGHWSTLNGGDWSTLTGGYESTLTGGDRSTLTGGNQSVMCFWWYEEKQNKWHREVVQVGRDNIKPNVAYKCVDGKIVEAEGGAA